MEINTNLSAGGINGATPPRRSGSAAKAVSDGTSFARSTALEEALKNLPDSRPEAIDRARELTANPNYPPLVLIEKLAVFLAGNLTSESK